MTRKVHYLGKPSSGAWAHPPRKTPTPINRPFLERPTGKLLVICLSGLIALAVASWGWPMVIDYMADRIEVGVTRD